MIKTFYAQILLACALSAYAAVPSGVLFQGTMAEQGNPLTGKQLLEIQFCDALTAGNCNEVYKDLAFFQAGYFSVILENLPVLDKPYWVDISANRMKAGTRIPLTSVPFATSAAHADKAALADSAAKAGWAAQSDTATFASTTSKAGVATSATTAEFAESIPATAAVISLNQLQGPVEITGTSDVQVSSSGQKLVFSSPTLASLLNRTRHLRTDTDTSWIQAPKVVLGRDSAYMSLDSAKKQMLVKVSDRNATAERISSLEVSLDSVVLQSHRGVINGYSNSAIRLNPGSIDMRVNDAVVASFQPKRVVLERPVRLSTFSSLASLQNSPSYLCNASNTSLRGSLVMVSTTTNGNTTDGLYICANNASGVLEWRAVSLGN